MDATQLMDMMRNEVRMARESGVTEALKNYHRGAIDVLAIVVATKEGFALRDKLEGELDQLPVKVAA